MKKALLGIWLTTSRCTGREKKTAQNQSIAGTAQKAVSREIKMLTHRTLLFPREGLATPHSRLAAHHDALHVLKATCCTVCISMYLDPKGASNAKCNTERCSVGFTRGRESHHHTKAFTLVY